MADRGRPTEYNIETTSEICSRIASGEKVSEISKDDHMPAARTVYIWLSKHKEFSEQYAQAQADRAHAMAEEILDIADDGQNDWMEREHGGTAAWVANGEALQRSRLRVDTRKWLMSKMMPKKYGEKVTQEVSGPNGGPIETKDTSSFELLTSRIASIIARTPTQGSDGGSDTGTSS